MDIYVVKGPDGPTYFSEKRTGEAYAFAIEMTLNNERDYDQEDIERLKKAIAEKKTMKIREALEYMGAIHLAELRN